MIKQLLIVLALLMMSFGNTVAVNGDEAVEMVENINTTDFKTTIEIDSEAVFLAGKPEDHLYDALIYYGVKYPEIVYAQAIIETGYFKSKGCKNKNNLFGLMRGKKLRSFDHWTESIVYYREHIQNRYKGGDYYRFLKRIGYASDPKYITKVRRMSKKH